MTTWDEAFAARHDDWDGGRHSLRYAVGDNREYVLVTRRS